MLSKKTRRVKATKVPYAKTLRAAKKPLLTQVAMIQAIVSRFSAIIISTLPFCYEIHSNKLAWRWLSSKKKPFPPMPQA